MSSKTTYEYYGANFKKMSPLRAVAQSLFFHRNAKSKIEVLTASKAYNLASCQAGVTVTDMPIYEEAKKRFSLPENACILNDNHGAIVGRNAGARKFYNKSDSAAKAHLEEVAREAVFCLQKKSLIQGNAVIGLDSDLMLKASMITIESDANNLWNWLHNFMPYELYEEEYKKSKPLPIQDILVIADPEWVAPKPEYKEGLVIVDPYENIIFSLGMRYFGERKKGTLTLASRTAAAAP